MVKLASLNGDNGFAINGIDPHDISGDVVSSAGDFNGDGYDDVIIGARYADLEGDDGKGESYLIYGTAGGFSSSLNLSALDGTDGFVLNGVGMGGSGSWVSSAGDVNGDGFDDIIIFGRDYPYANDDNYVVFGAASGYASPFDLSALDGSNGFSINGIGTGSSSVSSAGDVNGDGFDDLLIGVGSADANGVDDAGQSYVIFGAASGFSSSFDLANIDGTNGFVLNGVSRDDFSGFAVSSAGDVNGDGFDDILIGAYTADAYGRSNSGKSYVVFGAASGFSSSFDLSTLDGTNGFILNGHIVDDWSGYAVSSAGDVNGDGFDDIIIGAFYADPNGIDGAGITYVVFGAADGFSASLDLFALDGTNGFAFIGVDESDWSGRSVSSAGDVNADGFDDILIGASNAAPTGLPLAGQSYLVYGTASGFSPTFDLSTLNGLNGFVLDGASAYENSGGSVSAAGDVNGDGFDDVIIGAIQASPGGNTRAGRSYVVFGFKTPTIIADEDFEGGAFGWSNNTTNNQEADTFSEFLGRVRGDGGDQSLFKSYDVSDTGRVTITFDMYRLDTWDREDFTIFINDDAVLTENHYGWRSLGDGSGSFDGGSWTREEMAFGQLGFKQTNGSSRDAIYRYEFIIDNIDAEKLKLGFGSNTNSKVADESFGIDNLLITQQVGDSLPPSNDAPAIVSAPDVTVEENQSMAIDVQSSDDNDSEGAGLVYDITGGDDGLLFDIDPDTGEVNFKSVPDFEAPDDTNADNVYELQVTVADSAGLAAVQDIMITVRDVNENITLPAPVFEIAGVTTVNGNANNVVNTAPSSVLEIPEGTITFSFIADDVDSRQGLVVKDAKQFTGGGNHFASLIYDGELIVRFQDGGAKRQFAADIEVGQEYEVAALFGPDGVAFYFNGVLQGEDSSFITSWETNVEYLQVGGLGWSSETGADTFNKPFEGAIADVEIFNENLNQDQISQLALMSSFDV